MNSRFDKFTISPAGRYRGHSASAVRILIFLVFSLFPVFLLHAQADHAGHAPRHGTAILSEKGHAVAAVSAPLKGPVKAQDLRRHIAILASDDFAGRFPGTPGGIKTISYIAQQWADIGLQAAAQKGQSWYQPIELIERRPVSGKMLIFPENSRRKGFEIGNESLILRGAQARSNMSGSSVVYAGYALLPEDEISPHVRGKTVIMHRDSPRGVGKHRGYRARKQALIDAGAAALIIIIDSSFDWQTTARQFQRGGVHLNGPVHHAPVEAIIEAKAAKKLIRKLGRDLKELKVRAKKPDFAPLALGATADIIAETQVRSFQSYNVMGKIAGTQPAKGAILFLAHWDHLGDHMGLCGADLAPGIICNGAVDNASGIALLIETARHLKQGTRPLRDIYFLATSAEELGLLGAKAFAENPPIALNNFKIAFNADTVAVADNGTKIALVGYGETEFDDEITDLAKRHGRTVDQSNKPNRFLRRQDGWVLMQKNIPSLMVSSAFADRDLLKAFLSGPYHRPEDKLDDKTRLGGAVDDANFHIILGQYFANNALSD